MSRTVSNKTNSQFLAFEKPAKQPSSYQLTQKPLILAVETSGRFGSVAIAHGEKNLAEKPFSGPMKHSAEIFPAICRLLQQLGRKPKEIKHIYISIGPGSFTGLRIAAALAKTMNLANAVKIVTVDTLYVIAANANDYMKQSNTNIEKIATILDAKRGQFYIAVYQRKSNEQRATSDGIWEKVFPDSLMTASQFLDKFANKQQPLWLLGEGLLYYKDKFKTQGICFLDDDYWYPKASKVHLLGWQLALVGRFADPLTLQPAYMRKADVKEKQK